MRPAAFLRSAVAALALAAVFGVRADDRAGGRSSYVQEDPARRIAVVFVHGGAGSAHGTWKNAEADQNWPEMIAGDDAFPPIRARCSPFDHGPAPLFTTSFGDRAVA